jgi:glycogen(starch) synthase
MRILLWGNCYPRVGGIETFIGHLARALAERGEAVGILSDGPGGREKLSVGIPVWTSNMLIPIRDANPDGILAAQAAIRRALDEFAPDILHYNTSATEIMLFLRATRDRLMPVVTTLHNAMFLECGSDLLRRVCDRSGAMIAVSDHIRSAWGRRFPDLAESVQVIANALPPGLPPQPLIEPSYIVAFGRIIPEKGFHTLVEAFALLAETHVDARLTIWGDGPDRAKLLARAAALGLVDRVAFPGWCEPAQVTRRMAGAGIVAMPSSWQEPFGLVALEAAQAARPVVASRVGALPTIIDDGETGLLVPPDDPPALAAALARLLAAPTMAQQLGRTAHARIDRRFSFATMVDAYQARFEAAVSARTAFAPINRG